MTTLHAGGKFGGKVYDTSGGLHGVGASVVNALSEWMEVDVARDRHAHKMRFERGQAVGKLKDAGRGQPARHDRVVQARSADFRQGHAFLAGAALSHGALEGLSVPRRGNPLEMRALAHQRADTPAEDTLKFPGGLLDFLKSEIEGAQYRHAARILRPHGKPRRQRRGGMGGGLGAGGRSVPALLLQHHPHAAGRHA